MSPRGQLVSCPLLHSQSGSGPVNLATSHMLSSTPDIQTTCCYNNTLSLVCGASSTDSSFIHVLHGRDRWRLRVLGSKYCSIGGCLSVRTSNLAIPPRKCNLYEGFQYRFELVGSTLAILESPNQRRIPKYGLGRCYELSIADGRRQVVRHSVQ